ncbi:MULTISPECIES: GntR family transcriptional regulator [unclassified Chitinophaga]|uniref:GntR family transcriptional regulator n=1 Tax=unclassified Chitinophaga TaxID=2619133 RepID=UPI0009C61C0D|nr:MULTISPECIES: GntR family transcriptional regulator [unclassified Chitinophaga]OMP80753.1 GntR family transcriptional regulator [[Flexibacter] sp. ATCC 35208]WPV70109.1 GntR family transcriptional regulator [Chitinophaga sp. LS1]
MEISIDHQNPVPLHLQAEQLLRNMIRDPKYAGGQFLPNEVELAKQLAISRSTLRQALNKLVYEGLLVRKKGVGTKVADLEKISSKAKNWISFTQEMQARGLKVRNFELHVTWVLPDNDAVAFFGIPANQKILKLERLRGTPEGPFVYFISWFHPGIGLTGEEDFKRQLYDILDKDYGVVATLSKEEVSARAADKFVAAKLEIDAGSPVLFRRRFVYDKDDLPIEYNVGYYRPDSFVYTVESRRE